MGNRDAQNRQRLCDIHPKDTFFYLLHIGNYSIILLVLDFWRGGRYESNLGEIRLRDSSGYSWTSCTKHSGKASNTNTISAYENTSYIWLPGDNYRGYGFPIQCVAQRMINPNPGTSPPAGRTDAEPPAQEPL